MDVKKRKRNRAEERRKKRYCCRYCRCINFFVGDGYDRCRISSGGALRLQTNIQTKKKKLL
jgi:hypothetical protein